MTMYAITTTGYRAVADSTSLQEGETIVVELPTALLLICVAQETRKRRDVLLRACDWTQMPDAPLGLLDKAQWATYRQALRDFPSLSGFPDVPWPDPPTLPVGAAQTNGSAMSK